MKTEMIENSWLFYKIAIPAGRPSRVLPEGYTCEMWWPGIFRLNAKGLPAFPFVVWWVLHMLRVFANRGYGLFIIRRGEEVVHRSVITPGYFRFPFMSPEDIQIGDTWTDPQERGKGLATVAIEKILAAQRDRECNCWYIVEPGNLASIRVVERTRFTLAGYGTRTRRLGLGILGCFILAEGADLEHRH